MHLFQKAAALHETMKTALTGVWKFPPIKLLKATWNLPPKEGGRSKICDSHFVKPLLIRPQLLFVRIPFLGQKGKGRRWVTLRLLPFCVASKQCRTNFPVLLLSFPSPVAPQTALFTVGRKLRLLLSPFQHPLPWSSPNYDFPYFWSKLAVWILYAILVNPSL